MNTLKDFINFVKKPTEFFSEKLSSKEKLKILITLLFFEFVFILVIVCPVDFFVDEYIVTVKEELVDWGLAETIFALVLFAPIVEEILFRLPLRYNRNYIFKLFGKRVQKIWSKHYAYFFYAFAVAFGLFHISNFSNSEIVFFAISPLIILSQLSGGVVLGYIRLKAGLFWGMLYHGLFNGIIVVIPLLFYHNVETISYTDAKIQKFTVHELEYIDKDSQSSEIMKNANGDLIELHFNDMNLQGVIDSLGLKKNLKESDFWIDLDIVAPEGISKEKVLEILEKEYKFEG